MSVSLNEKYRQGALLHHAKRYTAILCCVASSRKREEGRTRTRGQVWGGNTASDAHHQAGSWVGGRSLSEEPLPPFLQAGALDSMGRAAGCFCAQAYPRSARRTLTRDWGAAGQLHQTPVLVARESRYLDNEAANSRRLHETRPRAEDAGNGA
jgi:hypothetical protein